MISFLTDTAEFVAVSLPQVADTLIAERRTREPACEEVNCQKPEGVEAKGSVGARRPPPRSDGHWPGNIDMWGDP